MDAPPLVLAADAALRDELVRLAAAAGSVPEVLSATGPEALAAWPRASAAVVGGAEAVALAEAGAGRRAAVLVCCAEDDAWGPDDPALLRAALALGADRVASLPHDAAAVTAALADAGDPVTSAPVVAVVGGSGGAGASVLAAALATRAAARGPTVLVDLDPVGPGAARLLGLDDGGGIGWPDLARGAGRLAAAELREAVPRTPAGVGVLGWPGSPTSPGAATVREAVAAAARGHRAVVADLPRADLATHRELVAAARAVVLVARATVPGAWAAARLLGEEPLAAPATLRRTLLVVRGDAQAAERLGRALALDPVATVPDHRGLPESLDLGRWPVPARGRPPRGRAGAVGRAADAVWREVDAGRTA